MILNNLCHLRNLWLRLLLVLCVTLPATAESPDVRPMLDAGEFDEAKKTLAAHLGANADDHDARLALGVTTFLAGIEEFAQTSYTYGVRNGGRDFGMILPMLAVPVRENPNPKAVTLDDVRAMLKRFEESLVEVDDILKPIGDAPANMPLRIGTVKMDLNGDGELSDDEGLWRFYEAMTRRGRRGQGQTQEKANDFVLGLDTADAYWLRGYCHVMGGLTDVLLAHDGTELFNRAGHLLFRNPQTPYPWLNQGVQDQRGGFNEITILDFIAAIHLLNVPVQDAPRMAKAHAHFKQVVELSRLSWKSIRAETDDNNEWVPGPNQQGAIGINLTEAQIGAWLSFLDEADAILDGKKLLPFWRGDNEKLGINFKRVFTEPTRFDLILWVQGTAAQPYLEEGDVTDSEFWGNLNQQFGRNFPGFAFWIN